MKQRTPFHKRHENWHVLHSDIVYQGRLTVMKDRLLKPTGHEMDYTYLAGKGASATLAFNDDQQVILTYQYRHPLRKMVFDLPAGGILENESPEQAAVRELKEETGFTAHEIYLLGQFYPGPGLMSQVVHVFCAKSLEIGNPAPDEHEIIEVVFMDWTELLQMVLSGDGIDVALAYAVMMYAMHNP
jgi:ADP-ribose pyrophosphatase